MQISAKPITADPCGPVFPVRVGYPPAQAGLVALAPGVACLFADRPATEAGRPCRVALDAGDASLPRPMISAALPLIDGGTRHVVLLGQDAAALARRRLDMVLGGCRFATIDPGWLQSPIRAPQDLSAGLADAGAARLARLLLTAGARLFARQGGPTGLVSLLARLGLAGLGRVRWHRTGLRSGLLSVPLPAVCGTTIETVALVTARRARLLPAAAVMVERTPRGAWLHLCLPERPPADAVLAGLAARPFLVPIPQSGARGLPALDRRSAEFAGWLVGRLEAAAAADEVAGGLLDELRADGTGAAGARIVHLARTRSGVFLAVEAEGGAPCALRVAVEGHVRSVRPRAGGERATAFLAFPGPIPSGAAIRVGEIRRSGRSAVLHDGALPALALATCPAELAGPALARALLDGGGGPIRTVVEQIGTGHGGEAIALVVRFGSEEALQALAAKLAAEPGARQAGLVVVAEAGAEAARARRVLRSGHLVFGHAARLVAVRPGEGGASALAAALSVTRSDRALLIGRDVLPHGRGWLRSWTRAIRPGDGAPVGGALLAPDGSVLHAGGPAPETGAAVEMRARGLTSADLPARRRVPTRLVTAACAGLGRAGIDAFLAVAPSCPDADALLSLLAIRSGGAATRLDHRFVRYGAEADGEALGEALLPHTIAALLAGATG